MHLEEDFIAPMRLERTKDRRYKVVKRSIVIKNPKNENFEGNLNFSGLSSSRDTENNQIRLFHANLAKFKSLKS